MPLLAPLLVLGMLASIVGATQLLPRDVFGGGGT
jgi:hypothetical protein